MSELSRRQPYTVFWWLVAIVVASPWLPRFLWHLEGLLTWLVAERGTGTPWLHRWAVGAGIAVAGLGGTLDYITALLCATPAAEPAWAMWAAALMLIAGWSGRPDPPSDRFRSAP